MRSGAVDDIRLLGTPPRAAGETGFAKRRGAGSAGMAGAKPSWRRCNRGQRSSGLRDHAVSHLAQALDLGLHDIARREESVGALTDAAAGAAAEDVARLDGENMRGVFDLL